MTFLLRFVLSNLFCASGACVDRLSELEHGLSALQERDSVLFWRAACNSWLLEAIIEWLCAAFCWRRVLYLLVCPSLARVAVWNEMTDKCSVEEAVKFRVLSLDCKSVRESVCALCCCVRCIRLRSIKSKLKEICEFFIGGDMWKTTTFLLLRPICVWVSQCVTSEVGRLLRGLSCGIEVIWARNPSFDFFIKMSIRVKTVPRLLFLVALNCFRFSHAFYDIRSEAIIVFWKLHIRLWAHFAISIS